MMISHQNHQTKIIFFEGIGCGWCSERRDGKGRKNLTNYVKKKSFHTQLWFSFLVVGCVMKNSTRCNAQNFEYLGKVRVAGAAHF